MHRLTLAIALLALSACGRDAAPPLAAAMDRGAGTPLTEQQATAKAVAILRGDVYGDVSLTIRGSMKAIERLTRVPADCGPGAVPVWGFHVVTRLDRQPIDGWLYLDAVSGRQVCSTLPFID